MQSENELFNLVVNQQLSEQSEENKIFEEKVRSDGVEHAGQRTTEVLIEKFLPTRKLVLSFVLEELDAMRFGDETAKNFVNNSGFSMTQFKGSMKTTEWSGSSNQLEQMQLFLRAFSSKISDKTLSSQFMVVVVDNLMKKFKLGKYSEKKSEIILKKYKEFKVYFFRKLKEFKKYFFGIFVLLLFIGGYFLYQQYRLSLLGILQEETTSYKIYEKVFIAKDNNLMWQNSYHTSGSSFYIDNVYGRDAESFGEANSYCYSLEYAGYSDWRLPSMKEGVSLLTEYYGIYDKDTYIYYGFLGEKVFNKHTNWYNLHKYEKNNGSFLKKEISKILPCCMWTNNTGYYSSEHFFINFEYGYTKTIENPPRTYTVCVRDSER
ncbi:Protein of unknown function (DUF1566) [Thiovulum sp. ES]|nr:Protein of unknown function (DUF1566) [Thiovulum sp. ES]